MNGPGMDVSLTIALGFLALSAAVSLLGPRAGKTALALAALGSVALAVVGGLAAFQEPVALHFGTILGSLSVDLRYDALAAPFLIALGVVGTAASIYAMGHHDGMRSRLDGVAYPAFLASLGLLFGADTAFAFLLAWEAMALSSAALVFGPRPGPTTVRAGYVYLALTHLAAACLVAAFALLGGAAGHADFAAMREAAQALDPAARDVVFLLLLVGFATKAGIVPLHIWLPRAHPEAPSHVSALMSGVMVKAGIFGVLRVVIGILGPGPAWWALAVIVLGAGSAVLGALYALVERDLKRLLAFSTIENVGIIFLGLGVGLLGATVNAPALTTLGLAAALVHTLNHAAFKGLLFLAAGSIQSATGTRDLDKLGGLVRAMPWTALLFGVGAVALAGVPPFSGFAGEWLIFQSLLTAGAATAADPVIRIACLLAVGALALSVGLALGAIVKASGSAFLALPRSPRAGAALEVGRLERAAAALLALVTLGAGLFAGPIRILAGAIVEASSRSTGATLGGSAPVLLGSYEPIVVASVLALIVVAAWAIGRWRAAPVRRAPTWACGIAPTAAHEYTATSFDKPARLFFEPILRPVRARRVEFEPGTPFPHRVTYRSNVDHLVESRLYVPLHRASIAFAQIARRLQQGTLQLYVAYTVVALVILLVAARP